MLVVDDEDDIRELLDMTLSRMGLDADCAANLGEARSLLSANSYQLCLTDMRLPDGDGLELVRYIGEQCRDLPVAVITAHGSMENAVSALKAGAFDYVPKPVSLEQLRALVKSVLNLPSQDAARSEAASSALLGESQAIRQARAMIEKVARSQAPVYIGGESGSGKELAARLIHGQGARREQAFVAVNCGAIPETLMESEFFGYKKGAFTGADADRGGFFQAAHGGTLFLDEVADLPLNMQVKLLRAIQERRIVRVGGETPIPLDIRLYCATNRDLKEMVELGQFREDLFYRINVIQLRIPPLRERKEDILWFARIFLDEFSAKQGGGRRTLTQRAEQAFLEYPWPGNIRELRHAIERACIISADATLGPEAFFGDGLTHWTPPAADGNLGAYLQECERNYIRQALLLHGGHISRTAEGLGISRKSLWEKMRKLGLQAHGSDEQ